jgi:hypothetical protein
MGPWHEHHYRFWSLIVTALGLLVAAHYILFAVDSDLSKLPPDLLHSPDAILFTGTFLGLFLLAFLVRSELRQPLSADHHDRSRVERNHHVHFHP